MALADRLRVIIDSASPGYWNMAVDEALFLHYRPGDEPILRLYMWSPTTVSIGYGESLSASVDTRLISILGWHLVRRPTGGGVIIHEEDGEVTYSLIAPGELVGDDIASSSAKIARGIALALQRLGVEAVVGAGPYNRGGPPLCYARGGESAVMVRGRKISGSAQRRRGWKLLQHGTLVVSADYQLWAQVLKMHVEQVRKHTISLTEVLGEVKMATIIDALIEGFSEALNLEPYRDKLDPDEKAIAEALVYKYRSREWTNRIP